MSVGHLPNRHKSYSHIDALQFPLIARALPYFTLSISAKEIYCTLLYCSERVCTLYMYSILYYTYTSTFCVCSTHCTSVHHTVCIQHFSIMGSVCMYKYKYKYPYVYC